MATTLAQLAVLLGLLVLVGDDPGLAGLAAAAGALSVISAFQQPAAIVFPRLLITREEQFSRALARISGSTHIARILGVSFGGIAISVWPLAALLAVCAFLAGLSLVVLTALRPSAPTPPARVARPGSGTPCATASDRRMLYGSGRCWLRSRWSARRCCRWSRWC